jgi:hypothetical protein
VGAPPPLKKRVGDVKKKIIAGLISFSIILILFTLPPAPSLQAQTLSFTNQYAYNYKPNQYTTGNIFAPSWGVTSSYPNGSRYFNIYSSTFNFEYKAPGVQYAVGDDIFLGWTAVEASGRDDINIGNIAFYGSRCLQINVYASGGYVAKTDFNDPDGNVEFNMVFKLSDWGDGAGSNMVFSLLGLNGVQIATWRLATTSSGGANLDWYITSYSTLKLLSETQWISLTIKLNRVTNQAIISDGINSYTRNLRNPGETGFTGFRFDWMKGADDGAIIYIDSISFKRLNRDEPLPCRGIANDWHYYTLKAPGSVNFATYKFMQHKVIAKPHCWKSYVCNDDYGFDNILTLTFVKDWTYSQDYVNAYAGGLTTTITPRLVVFFNDSFIIDSWRMYYVKLAATPASFSSLNTGLESYITATDDGALRAYLQSNDGSLEYIIAEFDIPDITLNNNYTSFTGSRLGSHSATLTFTTSSASVNVNLYSWETGYTLPFSSTVLTKISFTLTDNNKYYSATTLVTISPITITPVDVVNYTTFNFIGGLAGLCMILVPSLFIGFIFRNKQLIILVIPVFTIIAYISGLIPLWLTVMIILGIVLYIIGRRVVSRGDVS